MSREIKFRAWDKASKQFLPYWTQGQMVENTNESVVVMQYTGLKDKNGKEIWEGDIVLDFDDDTSCSQRNRRIHIVEFERGSFLPVSEYPDCKYFEVIGNIYENPNLIK